MGAGIFAILFALGVGADALTASMCGACHEIQPQVETMAQSGHAQLRCPECHEPSRPWYRFPETLATRAVMLSRNLGPHLSFEVEGEQNPFGDNVVRIEDAKCLECHDPGREVTLQEGDILIDHEEHVRLNDSCISCHRYTAHPKPGVDPAVLFMSQCFTCHGLTEDAEASGECEVCHDDEFELVPTSHDAAWRQEHGGAALEDRDICSICHQEEYCQDCHGIDMPHPGSWAAGDPVHGDVSRQDRTVCENCHGGAQDFCAVCHHEDFLPTLGTWVGQHTTSVSERGAAYCMECHEPTFCVACHTAEEPATSRDD
jgi:hypothetical protein